MNKKTLQKRRDKALKAQAHYKAVQFYESLRAKGIKDPDTYLKALVEDFTKRIENDKAN